MINTPNEIKYLMESLDQRMRNINEGLYKLDRLFNTDSEKCAYCGFRHKDAKDDHDFIPSINVSRLAKELYVLWLDQEEDNENQMDLDYSLVLTNEGIRIKVKDSYDGIKYQELGYRTKFEQKIKILEDLGNILLIIKEGLDKQCLELEQYSKASDKLAETIKRMDH